MSVSTDIREHLPYTTEDVIGARAKIGLVVLASDYTIEHEFRQVFTLPGVDYYQARIENSNVVTPETLADMQQRISATVNLILPGHPLDVVAYGCTSATMVLGEETVTAEIKKVQPEAKVTTPATAAFAAFDAFEAKRIAVLTPYRHDVNVVVRDYIINAGYDVPVFGSFNQESDPIVARIDERSLVKAIESLTANASVDMVFVSCTSVRLLNSAASIEQALGIPVTSSNHALAWHCMRLAGVDDTFPALGQLYQRQLAASSADDSK